MNRYLLACLLLLPAGLFAQNPPDTSRRTLSPAEANELFAQLHLDSTALLKESVESACTCIDSVRTAGGDKAAILKGINHCIDRASIGYQATFGVMRSMNGGPKEVIVDIDPKSARYQRHYFRIESALKDSCPSLNRLLVSNDEETSDKSMSTDYDARMAYNKGLPFLEKGDYKGAIPWFEKAVDYDADFAFAWDNLGISYRKTNQLEKAVNAYRASLKADPKGKTPLQNLPVALGMMGRADEALAAYQHLLEVYPGDPEGHYGMGMIYYQNKKDYLAALDQFCLAYNIYVEQKSPYRSDAETMVSVLYRELKKAGKEADFDAVLTRHHLSPNK